MKSRADILDRLKATLDRERFNHTLRVEKIALELADKFGADRTKAGRAALLHDCARRFDRAGLLKAARRLRLRLDPVRLFEPKLFHGEIGRHLAVKEFGVRDREILAAIENHTTGRPGMSRLEKIVYLADHIEIGRRFAGIDKVRRLARRDLDRAIVAFADTAIAYFLKKKLPFHPGTVETRNFLLLNKGKNGA